MACTAGGARAPARLSGSSARSSLASRRRESTGAARRARSAPSCASANGRRRIRSGYGSTARPRCDSPPTLAPASKIERAALLALAFADLCVRGGERVGLIGLTRPLATRGVIERFAEAIAPDERLHGASGPLPPALPAAPRSMVLDRRFSLEPEDVAPRDRGRERRGREGRALMIADPIEETFPFAGNTEFLHPAGALRLLAPRAQNLRDAYLERLAAHREAMRAICARSAGACASIAPTLRLRRPCSRCACASPRRNRARA